MANKRIKVRIDLQIGAMYDNGNYCSNCIHSEANSIGMKVCGLYLNHTSGHTYCGYFEPAETY